MSLYRIAENAENRGIKQDIGFSSIKDLLNKINREEIILSESTLRRLLKSKEYEKFFTIEEFGAMKWIILNNDFSKSAQNK